MSIKWVILWTDALLLILLIAFLYLVFKTLKSPRDQAIWGRVCATPARMTACILLVFFTLITALDSVHYREAFADSIDGTIDYSGTVYSVLDKLLMPLPKQLESTYSAPFATTTFTKELIVAEDGSFSWNTAPLKFVASNHHAEVNNKQTAISLSHLVWKGVAIGSGIGVGIVLLLISMCSITTGHPFIQNIKILIFGKTKLPWRTASSIFILLCLLVALMYQFIGEYHLLGTDKVGRDVFYSAVKSIRTGFVIGTITTLIMLPFAVLLGTMAGYFRGWVDDVIQYLYTTLSSIPGVLLIAASVLTLQLFMEKNADSFEVMLQRTDLRLLMLCFILGITSWTSLCRLLRAETLKLREMDYVLSARAMGVGHGKIIIRHIIPNTIHIILIAVALDFSGLVLAEAVLSYVGVGVDPNTYSWGNMINAARLEMAREPIIWWSLTAAFIMMFSMVIAANIFADALRDALDPKVTVGNS